MRELETHLIESVEEYLEKFDTPAKIAKAITDARSMLDSVSHHFKMNTDDAILKVMGSHRENAEGARQDAAHMGLDR